jgi:isopentenyl-diphosphate Delta-isomerase
MSEVNTNEHHSGPGMSARKAQHLSICIDDQQYSVESSSTRLGEAHLVHHALPEVNASDVTTATTFLERPVAMPLFISSMTGGSDGAYQVNKDLATVAEALKIPVGMGSIRILLRKPDVIEHFRLKQFAPSVPVFANIGGVQLPREDHDRLYRLVEELRVDAIAVHLNPGQELVQPGGDHDFAGVTDGIARFVAGSPVPVIVKETGFGIHPAEVARLLDMGVRYVDIAGAGGTNWNRVEGYRNDDPAAAAAAMQFDRWGIPTGLALAALGRSTPGILASGGIRTGMDVLTALALGARGVGMALPFVRHVVTGGVDGAVAFGREVEYVIRTGMVLSGVTRVDQLRTAPMWMEEGLRADAASLRGAWSP